MQILIKIFQLLFDIIFNSKHVNNKRKTKFKN